MLIGSVVSIKFGAAFAKTLFDQLGPAGATFVRLASAAVLLLVVVRPSMRGRGSHDRSVAILFGAILAGMNLSYYLAIERIPLGVASAIEFLGPLTVAIAGSRRWLDGVWVSMAGGSVVLLTGFGGNELDPVGVGLALISAACWGAYIVISTEIGRTFPSLHAVTIATAVAALLLAPAGIASAGTALLQPELLLAGAAVGLLASAVPYTLDLAALRRVTPRLFGLLSSTEPAVAALAGLLVLGEALGPRQTAAVTLVCVASVGATAGERRRRASRAQAQSLGLASRQLTPPPPSRTPRVHTQSPSQYQPRSRPQARPQPPRPAAPDLNPWPEYDPTTRYGPVGDYQPDYDPEPPPPPRRAPTPPPTPRSSTSWFD